MRRSSARSVALCAAVFLSACAALAAFETLSADSAAGGSAAAVMRGMATGVGVGAIHARLEPPADPTQLSRVSARRTQRWTGAVVLGAIAVLAAHGLLATGRGRRSRAGVAVATASSRAPPAVAMTLS